MRAQIGSSMSCKLKQKLLECVYILKTNLINMMVAFSSLNHTGILGVLIYGCEVKISCSIEKKFNNLQNEWENCYNSM